MKDKDWERILWNLQRQSCILLLGPESLPRDHGLAPATLARQLAVEADVKGEDLPLAYVAHQYATSSELSRDDLEREVVHFYQQAPEVPQIYRDLAALPFYFTLSTCHDDLLTRAFRDAGKTPSAAFYQYRGLAQDLVPAGTVQAPVVYSLFGAPRDPRSLVLTENDLLDLLVAVITSNPGLPANVRSELKKKGISFLFLGFGIRQWYLRILLHVLEFNHTDARSFAMEPLEAAPETADPVVLFFRTGYKIEVIPCELGAFASELRTRFGAGPSGPETRQAPAAPAVSPRVFLSYAHEDGDQAERLCGALRTAGLDVWMDTSGLEGGDVWDRTIEERVTDSDYFIVLQTPRLAQRSFSYVYKEIKLALDKQASAQNGVRFIIPLQMPGAPLLSELKDFQAISLASDADVAGLVSTVRRDYQRRSRG